MSSNSGLLIFDVGFNIGQDAAFYLQQGHRVIAVEADPTLAERGRNRFASELARGQLVLENVGVAAQEGTADFWICEGKPEFNSFHRGIAARDGYRHHAISVPTVRFESLLERHGTPHFLKIDIEGHDLLCIDALKGRGLPRYLSVESECPVDESGATAEDGIRVLERLIGVGYTRFKLIDQREFTSLSVPPSWNHRWNAFAGERLLKAPLHHVPGTYWIARRLAPRLRLQDRYRYGFPMGCSGPWGEDTPGPWIDADAAARAYRHYRQQHFNNATASHHSFWCDWHATS